MDEIIAKISSYNIFNNLVPGIVLIVAFKYYDIFVFKDLSLLEDLSIAYVAGMTVSRIGSVIIEPIVSFLGLVDKKNYTSFIQAPEKDLKLLVLLENANMYRTLVSVFLVLILSIVLDKYATIYMEKLTLGIIVASILSILYLVSFVKQSKFITKRVEHHVR